MVLALLAAGATWLVAGGPDRRVACDPATVEPGSVCLVSLEGVDEILWVDARTRGEWTRNGLPGSILLTDDAAEDWNTLFEEAAEPVAMSGRVVVYCGQEECGSSKAVAQKIRESGLQPDVSVLFGGWKALYAAGKITDSR